MQGLFFGLKAAVLVIVVEAVLRVGKRALKNNVMRALAAAAFVALFFFDVPFPLIIVGAGADRLARRSGGLPAFLAGGGARQGRAQAVADANSLLGRKRLGTPPNLRWSLGIGGVFLALWLVPVAALISALGRGNVFAQIALFFSKSQSSPSAAPMRCWPTWRNRRSIIITG